MRYLQQHFKDNSFNKNKQLGFYAFYDPVGTLPTAHVIRAI